MTTTAVVTSVLAVLVVLVVLCPVCATLLAMADEDRQKNYRMLAQYSTVIFILPSAVIGGFLLGRWIDSKLASYPWATVILVLLGTAGGFIEVFRLLNRKP